MGMTAEESYPLEEFIQTYSLQDVNRELLSTALVHRSYVYEMGASGLPDNERLEFLGDAVLSTIVAEYLYNHFQSATEGEMSRLRSLIVSRAMLARRAREMKLGELIKLGKGEEQSGGRQRSSIVGAALEAVVGAIYLSCGIERAKEFVINYIITPCFPLLESEDYIDYKSRLQELLQKHRHIIPEYRVVSAVGPEHNKTFTVEVWIDGKKYGTGTGSRKKIAENRAAEEAYSIISKELNGK